MARFLEVRYPGWHAAAELARRLTDRPQRDWIFRGQADATWHLESSLERAWKDFGRSNDLARREAWMLTQFQRRAHHYLAETPALVDRLEWVALMQHHGAPSRLLDFTYSFHVASAFAVQSSTQDAAVWALNMSLLRERSQEYLASAGNTPFSYLLECTRIADELLGRPAWVPADPRLSRTVICAEPSRLNERISTQRGLFVLPTDIELGFEQSLVKAFAGGGGRRRRLKLDSMKPTKRIDDADVGLVKMVLPKDKAGETVRALHDMNLHQGTLFPGLDGFARSLRSVMTLEWARWTEDDDANLDSAYR